MSAPGWQASLLPGGLREDGRRSARDRVVDGLVLVVAVAVGLFARAVEGVDQVLWLLVADVVAGVVSLVLLVWRRRHPDVVGVVTASLSVFSSFSAGSALVATFNVALRGSRRGIAAVAGVSVVVVTVYPLINPPPDPYVLNVVLGALLLAGAIGWGLFTRVRREQLLALRERAVRLEQEQRLRVAQARDAERQRIAYEMHDVLAHRISLLSVHAGALEFRPDAPPEQVAAAAAVIRTAARAALEELRQVVGVLRAEPGGPEEAEAPQPTLAELPALVQESRAAGMEVVCVVDVPDGRRSASGPARAAYRVVQEGLTNARKHAPGAPVSVVVEGAEDLVVEVRSAPSARRGGAAPGPTRSGSSDAAARDEPLPGSGTGLVGLRERVALAGGWLEDGPCPSGGFLLRATLPWSL